MLDRLSAVLDTGFSDHTLLVVSNREPYVHKKTRDGVVVDHDAEVKESWVGPSTYVGAMTNLSRSLAWADGLLDLEVGQTVRPGDWVRFIPFSELLA